MLDHTGSLLHIDFGYLLARTIKFEKAPFKLTEEMIEVMGGEKSKLFKKYVELLVQGFLAIRVHYEKILMLVEMTLVRIEGEGQFIPCLDKDSVVKNLRKRFRLEWNEVSFSDCLSSNPMELTLFILGANPRARDELGGRGARQLAHDHLRHVPTHPQ